MELLLSIATNQNDQCHEDVEYRVKSKEQRKESIRKYRLDLRLRLHLYFDLAVILQFLD